MECEDCLKSAEDMEDNYKGLKPKEISFHLGKLEDGAEKVILHVKAENGQLMFFNTNAQPAHISMLSDPKNIKVIFPTLEGTTFVRKE